LESKSVCCDAERADACACVDDADCFDADCFDDDDACADACACVDDADCFDDACADCFAGCSAAASPRSAASRYSSEKMRKKEKK
jgi:hypothetical protein